MQTQKKKLSELTPNENNVRRHNDAQIREFEKSIKSFGVLRPIVVDENNVILAGHGLYTALKNSGAKDADVLVVKGLSEKEKKKLMLADNKIYSLGFDEYAQIDKILKELGEQGDFEIPGYDSEALEELYGIKSIEKEIEQEGTPVERAMAQEEQAPEIPSSEKEPVPTKHVEEERAKAEEMSKNFVICPSCGEKIWL